MFLIKNLYLDNKKFVGLKLDLLQPPLLLIIGTKGIISCGYLNIDVLNKTNNIVAIVRGVSDFEDMLNTNVAEVSKAALDIGLKVGDKVKDILSYL